MVNDATWKRYTQYVILFVFFSFGAGSILYWGSPWASIKQSQKLNKELDSGAMIPDEIVLKDSSEEQLVNRYVTAYQRHDCGELARTTLWIQDRLRNINSETEDTDVRADMSSVLCGQLFVWTDSNNQISIFGIDDQYLIPTTVTFRIEGADSGRTDLEEPVRERVWCQFTYSDPGMAPKSENGDPIHSLRAGVNVSMSGLVLKGSVIGNWELDNNSISLQW